MPLLKGGSFEIAPADVYCGEAGASGKRGISQHYLSNAVLGSVYLSTVEVAEAGQGVKFPKLTSKVDFPSYRPSIFNNLKEENYERKTV
jgi:hypothetical protein